MDARAYEGHAQYRASNGMYANLQQSRINKGNMVELINIEYATRWLEPKDYNSPRLLAP